VIDGIDTINSYSLSQLDEATKNSKSCVIVIFIGNIVDRTLSTTNKGFYLHLPEFIMVFEPLQTLSIKEIITSRCFGLFEEDAAYGLAKHRDIIDALKVASCLIDAAMRRTDNINRLLEVGDFSIVDEEDVEAKKAAEEASSQCLIQQHLIDLDARVDNARTALLPGCRDFAIIGRDKEFNIILQGLRTAISEECGLGLYLCGMSGGGKTATVEKVFQALGVEQTHKVVRVCGADLKEPFTCFAERLGWRGQISGWCEKTAEDVCMRRFVLSPTSKKAEEKVVFILFIDEIDKLPRISVKKLYTAAKAINSRLVVVGIANHVKFPNEIGLEKEDLPELIVFATLQKIRLKEIIASRTFGLFTDAGQAFLAATVTNKSSDVRLLLDLSAGCINLAIALFKEGKRAFLVSDVVLNENCDTNNLKVGNFGIVNLRVVSRHLASNGQGNV
jgi:Cdc6-like AAA superfamily ATPase